MSEPSIQNIDKWMFELHEGNLSPAQEKMLMDFIAVHPELSVDLDAWKMAGVEAEPVQFDTQALIKNKRKAAPILWGALSVFVLGLGAGLALFYGKDNQSLYAEKQLDLSSISEGEIGMNSTSTNSFSSFDATSALSMGGVTSEGEANNFMANSNQVFDLSQFEENLALARTKKDFEENILKTSIFENEELFNTSNQQIFQERLDKIVAAIENSGTNPINQIQGEEPENLSSSGNHGNNSVHQSNVSSKSEASKRAFTLKRALYELGRDVKRTMNNPVALKNYRDQYYSLPSATGFTVNPGMVGTQVAPKFQWATRGQYLGTASNQISNRFSFDTYVYELKGGIGVDLNHNIINNGAVQTMEGAFTYSPKISIGEKFSFEPALRFRFGNKQINASKLVMGSVIELDRGRPVQFFEEGQTPTGQSLWYRDVQAGFLLNTPWFYLGASIDNVGRHFNNIYSNDLTQDFKAKQLYQAQIGTDYKSLSQKTVLSTYAVFQQQGSWRELWVGANVNFKGFHFGAAISNEFDPALSLGVDTKRVRFIYNADYSTSQIDDAKYLCHQLTLRYKLKPNRNARRILNM
ncbi:type IX secretion system membrane protein, PorP/SprF family [Lishizhenia tianjinensis]|uniref:Type IX secretion system membrane protein, PorP/SprF family n=1 Tax=Lishizhenia tianjinensis TaxID=477690 RepID=A0A1I6YSJ9_9FLAO|nr:PorP/SprF family type IX secretion system membrane protein [Lishizhenia tianjinensis]SFT53455.1 type IX secretion system membrane protein, PorP/SprF family [Lishizhenia tianjinensis]